MPTARKITVELPEELLKKAQRASGTGVTQTVRTGLELLAASDTYARLRRFRGSPLLAHAGATKRRSMIAADTSTWVAFLDGTTGDDTLLLDKALQDRQLVMVPVVLTEVLSDPRLPSAVAITLAEVPLIEIEPGFWQRAGALRAKVLARRRKARLGDALIAQTCIDAKALLITRDRDFRASAQAAALNLILAA
jgi:predicted nucleic acid-binding protein